MSNLDNYKEEKGVKLFKGILEMIKKNLNSQFNQLTEEIKNVIARDIKNNYQYEIVKGINTSPYIIEIKKTDNKLIDLKINTVNDILNEFTGERNITGRGFEFYESKYYDLIEELVDNIIDKTIIDMWKSPTEKKELVKKIKMVDYLSLDKKDKIRLENILDVKSEIPGMLDIQYNMYEKVFNKIKDYKISDLM